MTSDFRQSLLNMLSFCDDLQCQLVINQVSTHAQFWGPFFCFLGPLLISAPTLTALQRRPGLWQTQSSLLARQNLSWLLLDLCFIRVSESLCQVLRKSCWNFDEDYIYFIISFPETSHYKPEPFHLWEDLPVAGFCVASRKFESFLLRVVISIVNRTFKSITCFK